MAWSSDGIVICYVLPVLWMTSCFHIINRVNWLNNYIYVLEIRIIYSRSNIQM